MHILACGPQTQIQAQIKQIQLYHLSVFTLQKAKCSCWSQQAIKGQFSLVGGLTHFFRAALALELWAAEGKAVLGNSAVGAGSTAGGGTPPVLGKVAHSHLGCWAFRIGSHKAPSREKTCLRWVSLKWILHATISFISFPTQDIRFEVLAWRIP